MVWNALCRKYFPVTYMPLESITVCDVRARQTSTYSVRLPPMDKRKLLLFPCIRATDGPATGTLLPAAWPPKLTVSINGEFLNDVPKCATRSASARSYAVYDVTSFLPTDGKKGGETVTFVAVPESAARSVGSSEQHWEGVMVFASSRGEKPIRDVIDAIRARHIKEESANVAALSSNAELPGDEPVLPMCPDDTTCRFVFQQDHRLLWRHTCRKVRCHYTSDPKHMKEYYHTTNSLQSQKPGRKRRHDEIEDDVFSSSGSEDELDRGCLVGSVFVSLRCPLSFARMEIPVKGKDCLHDGCFDLTTYVVHCISLNAWNCPICDLPAFDSDLRIDELLSNALVALQSLDIADCDTICVFPEERKWRAVMLKEKYLQAEGSPHRHRPSHKRGHAPAPPPPPAAVRAVPAPVEPTLPPLPPKPLAPAIDVITIDDE